MQKKERSKKKSAKRRSLSEDQILPVRLESFRCPECGSTRVAGEWEMRPRLDAKKSWERVGWIILCGACGLQVPASVGRRWGNRTYEDAQREWQQHYRRYAVEIHCFP